MDESSITFTNGLIKDNDGSDFKIYFKVTSNSRVWT